MSTSTTTATEAPVYKGKPLTITADNVQTIFPDVDTSLASAIFPTSSGTSARDGGDLEGYDEEQIRLMDEVCIVLDENDRPIGSASKKTCLYLYLSPFVSGSQHLA